MKTLKKIGTVLLVILLIASALLFWRYKYVQSKYEQDYVALENDIFLPDSEGRGVSDKVRNNIVNNFPDAKIQSQFFKYAKVKRDILRSKTEDEYILKLSDLILSQNCVSFLIYLSENIQIKKNDHLVTATVQDNQDMSNFELYLENYKFNTESFYDHSSKILNDESLDVKTQKDFDEKCN